MVDKTLFPLNPGGLLAAMGTNSFDRNREKIYKTLKWIATFIWTNESVLNKVLEIKRRGWTRYLEKLGYIRMVESATRGGMVWVLSAQGMRMLESLETSDAEPVDYHYPDNPARQSQQNLRHDLVVQHIVADLLASSQVYDYKSGRALFRWSTTPAIWVPDAAVLLKNGVWAGIEYERTPKYGSERLIKLNIISEALNRNNLRDKPVKLVVWFYGHKKTELTEYIDALAGGMPLWQHGFNGRTEAHWHQVDGAVAAVNLRDGVEVVRLVLQDRDHGAAM